MNPKDVAAQSKLPVQLFPNAAIALGAAAIQTGGRKHGFWNWRKTRISLMEHMGAVKRHLMAYEDGENLDPESNLIHLAHALATLAIIIDAKACQMLDDDRPILRGGTPELLISLRK